MRTLRFLLLGSLLVGCVDGADDDGAIDDALTAAAAHPLVIDSLDGDVTPHEVDAFLDYASALAIPTSQFPGGGASHNYLADGAGGTTLEAINRMYEITGDLPGLSAEHAKLLDLAIRWSDAWLSHRNDLPLGEGRVMWTGHVEPIWPPDALPSTYAACEVGETVGILAYTALNIVATPAIAKQTVPDGDPHQYGKIYLARARTYVAMLDHTMDAYFDKYFLDRTTLTIHRPGAAAYNALASNNVNAWNREMMFLHAWQTLAQVHDLLGDDPARVAMYKTITRNTVDLFVANAQPRKAPDGAAVYDWGYGNFGDEKNHLTGEQIGIHAQYDIWGLTRAYRAGYTSATAKQMKTYADTVVHELTLSPGVYASFIDRCCDTSTYTYLPAGFMFLAPYNPALYKPGATADIQSGRQKSSATLTAGILWAKHALAAPATCTPTTCAAQGKTCGAISNGCGGTLACGSCASGQTCTRSNVCQVSNPSCTATLSSYTLGRCNGTARHGGTLYACVAQAAGVNAEPTGCGATGVYCSTIPPDDAAWGSVAWQPVKGCP